MTLAAVLQFQYTSLNVGSGEIGVAAGFLGSTLHMKDKQYRLFMPNIPDLWQLHSHLHKSNVGHIALNIHLQF